LQGSFPNNRELSRGIPQNRLADLLQLSVSIFSAIVHASGPLVPSLFWPVTASLTPHDFAYAFLASASAFN
jgi:hypothetical protein